MKLIGGRVSCWSRLIAVTLLCGAFLSACIPVPWEYQKITAADGTKLQIRVRYFDDGEEYQVAMPNGKWIACPTFSCAETYAKNAPNFLFSESRSDY